MNSRNALYSQPRLWFRWRRATAFLWVWMAFWIPVGLLLTVILWAFDIVGHQLDRLLWYVIRVRENIARIEVTRRVRFREAKRNAG